MRLTKLFSFFNFAVHVGPSSCSPSELVVAGALRSSYFQFAGLAGVLVTLDGLVTCVSFNELSVNVHVCIVWI